MRGGYSCNRLPLRWGALLILYPLSNWNIWYLSRLWLYFFFFACDRHTSSMLSHCPVSLHLLFLHRQNSSQSQRLLICQQKTVELWRQRNGDRRYTKHSKRLLHKGLLNQLIPWYSVTPSNYSRTIQIRACMLCGPMRTITFHFVDLLSLRSLPFSDSRSSHKIFFLDETNLKLFRQLKWDFRNVTLILPSRKKNLDG